MIDLQWKNRFCFRWYLCLKIFFSGIFVKNLRIITSWLVNHLTLMILSGRRYRLRALLANIIYFCSPSNFRKIKKKDPLQTNLFLIQLLNYHLCLVLAISKINRMNRFQNPNYINKFWLKNKLIFARSPPLLIKLWNST